MGFPALSVTTPRMTPSEAIRLALIQITAAQAHKIALMFFMSILHAVVGVNKERGSMMHPQALNFF
jgi:hypothetical protein